MHPSTLFLLFSCLVCLNCHCQVFQEKQKIIATFGEEYETGIDDKGNDYLVYETKLQSEDSGNYTRQMIFYFYPFQDSLEVCTHLKIIQPSTEKNNIIKFYSREMLKVKHWQWKDLSTGYLYNLQIVEPFCVLTIWYDDG